MLIVEGENKTADFIPKVLMEAGLIVDLARNGLDGHHLAMSETYDLVVLGVILPDVDPGASCVLCEMQANRADSISRPFRDDVGNTWSGHGRMLGWLKGKDKEAFRV